MTHIYWTQEKREGYDAWVGDNGYISLCMIPELGSKVISLVSRKTGREWLWRSGKPLGNKGFGTSFAESDESGWDEMFPSINECLYPEAPYEGASIPDHGEVWSLAWQAEGSGEELHCRVEGPVFPYTLKKTYRFTAENTLRIDYEVHNRGGSPLSFLWAAHPLLQITEGMRLQVTGSPDEIEVSYSAGSRLGQFGDKQPWPVIRQESQVIDLGKTEPMSAETAEKYYFTGKLDTGRASLHDPATGESIEFRFPARQVPYLAVWANYGSYGGYYHLAIEPATGRMDDLSHAMSTGETAVVPAGGKYQWHMEIVIA